MQTTKWLFSYQLTTKNKVTMPTARKTRTRLANYAAEMFARKHKVPST